MDSHIFPPSSSRKLVEDGDRVRQHPFVVGDNTRVIVNCQDAVAMPDDISVPIVQGASQAMRKIPDVVRLEPSDGQEASVNGMADLSIHDVRRQPVDIPLSCDLSIDQIAPQKRTGGSDWPVLYNRPISHALNVDLVHTLTRVSPVAWVTFSSDGGRIAIACGQSAQIFNVETGKELCVLNHSDDDKMFVQTVCFSSDGRHLATGARDKVIRVWDIDTKQIHRSFGGHTTDIASIDFARSGILASAGSEDEKVRLWDVNSGSNTLILDAENRVMTVAILPNTQYVAAGCEDKSIRIWQIKTGSPVAHLKGHTDPILSVAFSADGQVLVSGSMDQTIWVWDLSALQGGSNMIGMSGRCVGALEGKQNYVLSVAMTSDGERILAGYYDGSVWLWHNGTGTKQLITRYGSPVVSVALSPQGSLFASASNYDKTVHIGSMAKP